MAKLQIQQCFTMFQLPTCSLDEVVIGKAF